MHELDEWLPIDEAAKAVGRSVRSLQRWNTYGLLPRRRANGRTEFLRSGLFPARDILDEAQALSKIHVSGNGRPGPGRSQGPMREALDMLLDAGLSPRQAQAETRCSSSMLRSALYSRKKLLLWPYFERGFGPAQAVRESGSSLTRRQGSDARQEWRAHCRAQGLSPGLPIPDPASREQRALEKKADHKTELKRRAAASASERHAELFAYFDQGFRYKYLRDNGLTDLSKDYVQELLQLWNAERQADGAPPMKITEHSAEVREARRRKELFPYFEQGYKYKYLRDNGLTDLSKSAVNSLFQKWRNEQRETGNLDHGTTKD